MNGAEVPRAVFDCLVFLQGAARPTSPAKACLKLAEDGLIELCLSAAILAEVEDLLTRPETQQRFPALKAIDVEEFLATLGAYASDFVNVPEEFRYARDPKDEHTSIWPSSPAPVIWSHAILICSI